MKILLDSDFLFGLFVLHDPHHSKVTKLINGWHEKNYRLYALNLAIQETATVISHKANQQSAVKFVNNSSSVLDTIIIAHEKIESRAWKIFLKQSKKGTSFVDCANLSTLEEYNFDHIASFDKFYPKKLLLNL